MREFCLSHIRCQFPEAIDVVQLCPGDIEPAEPFRLVGAGPECGVPPPQASHIAAPAPVLEHILDGPFNIGAQARALPVKGRPQTGCTFLFDGGEKLVKSIGEQLHPFARQLRCDVV